MSLILQQFLDCRFEALNNEMLKNSEYHESMLNATLGKCGLFHYVGTIAKLEHYCRSRKFVVAKVIGISSLSDILHSIENGVKVLHLIRDPRSNWMSQIKYIFGGLKYDTQGILRFIKTTLPYSLTLTTCRDLKDDLNTMKRLLSNSKVSDSNHHYGNTLLRAFLDNYRVIRFEDIAEDAVLSVEAMYDFLGLEMHRRVLTWIEDNTKEDQK